MDFTLNYETGGEVLECEYVESWSRKVLVAKRSLGKEKDRVVLNRAMELATDTREMEEMGELEMKWDIKLESDEIYGNIVLATP